MRKVMAMTGCLLVLVDGCKPRESFKEQEERIAQAYVSSHQCTFLGDYDDVMYNSSKGTKYHYRFSQWSCDKIDPVVITIHPVNGKYWRPTL